MSGQRAGQVARYLALIGQGRSIDQAAEALAANALRGDFRYRSTRYIPTITIQFSQTPPIGPIEVAPLGDDEAGIIMLQARYQSGVEANDAAGFARRVRARVGDAPSDPAALQLLG